MALKRRQFTRDFKLQVVREVDAGKPMAQVARQHQINLNTVAKWRKQLRQYPQTALPVMVALTPMRRVLPNSNAWSVASRWKTIC
jgi:transposase